MNSFTALVLFSGTCFLFYGVSCIFSKRMVAEFERFTVPQYRVLTGILQVLGGLSLVIGYYTFPAIAFIASLGLAVLMLLGFGVRLKIKDSFALSAPSLLFACLNAFLAYKFALQLF